MGRARPVGWRGVGEFSDPLIGNQQKISQASEDEFSFDDKGVEMEVVSEGEAVTEDEVVANRAKLEDYLERIRALAREVGAWTAESLGTLEEHPAPEGLQVAPKLVLLDGEGIGHTAKAASSITTRITRRFAEVDLILIVDNAEQPMQTAPLELLRSIGSGGHADKLAVASLLEHRIEGCAFYLGDLVDGLVPTGALELLELLLDGLFMPPVVEVGELEEDQPYHRGAILRSLQVGVGAEVVGGGPEVGFELSLFGLGSCLWDWAVRVRKRQVPSMAVDEGGRTGEGL